VRVSTLGKDRDPCDRLIGDFHSYADAFRHSAASYTTLSTSDTTLPKEWQLLDPIEAGNGIVMGGFAAAVLYEVMNRLAQAHRRRRQLHVSG
jgi:hypothetical protein